MRGVVDAAELDELRAELERIFDEAMEHRPRAVLTRPSLDGGPTPDRLEPLEGLSSVVDSWLADERLAAAAGLAIDPPVRRFREKVIFKRPGTCGYELHQDWTYWQGIGCEPAQVASVTLALDRADASSGAIEVYTGQHRRLLAEPGVLVDPDPSTVDPTRNRLVELEAGDVALLHPLAPHRSGPNRSRVARTLLSVHYTNRDARAARRAYYEGHWTMHAHEVYGST